MVSSLPEAARWRAANPSPSTSFGSAPDDRSAVTLALKNLGGTILDVDVASELAPPGVDDYALLANDTAGLQVVDVTNPLQPALVATVLATGASHVFVEVQQMDRFIDEQGAALKENSHPGVDTLTREEIVRILSADISP